MPDENSQSIIMNHEEYPGTDDLGKFVGDTSFNDVTSDDSSGWMQRIDITNFQRLTSNSSIDSGNLQEPLPVETVFSTSTAQGNESEKIEQKPDVYSVGWVDSGNNFIPSRPGTWKNQPSSMPRSTTSRAVDSKIGAAKISPPMKKIRQRRSEEIPKSYETPDHQQQISVVSSSTDAARSAQHRQYPKPVYSYSCMIALALKNSQTGRLQVADIYCFMCENYPYFRTAPAGWKNSVRHNLSLNKCFEKVEVEAPGGHGRKCCLWTLNPLKITKMDQEIKKYREKDPVGVKESYARPEDLELIEQGLKGMPSRSSYYHSSAVGRPLLPEVVQHVTADYQQQEAQPYRSNDASSGSSAQFKSSSNSGYVGLGKSELALKLLQQAASYRHTQWQSQLHASSESSSNDWLPPQMENNRNNSTPGAGHCPLDSPIRAADIVQNGLSPLTFSTPIRRSSVAACYSPISHSQPDPHHRPSSWNPYYQQDNGQLAVWPNSNSPSTFDTRPLPVFGYRTPERPASCGYRYGDVMVGGNNSSLLVTPTADGHHQRYDTVGTSLEAAFCAATAHNNSLIVQSMQQQIIEPEELQYPPQLGVYAAAYQQQNGGTTDGSLHLTSL